MRIFEPILGDKANSLCETITAYQFVCEAEQRCIVSGDHTRTIQVATPTVGGLMKFAVKTATCLGCKTPLRANNSVKSESLARVVRYLNFRTNDPLLQTALCATTVGRDSGSSTRNRSPPRQSCKCGSRACGRSVNDARARCIRYVSNCRSFCMSKMLSQSRIGCPVFQSRLPDLLYAQEGAKGRGGRECGSRSLRGRAVVDALLASKLDGRFVVSCELCDQDGRLHMPLSCTHTSR